MLATASRNACTVCCLSSFCNVPWVLQGLRGWGGKAVPTLLRSESEVLALEGLGFSLAWRGFMNVGEVL